LVSVAALILYTLVSIFAPQTGLVFVLLLFLGLPWIVVRALGFNAVMSAWRGVRFGFDGQTW
jgi:uncharacterized membrane protein YjgN (DUF898 family)